MGKTEKYISIAVLVIVVVCMVGIALTRHKTEAKDFTTEVSVTSGTVAVQGIDGEKVQLEVGERVVIGRNSIQKSEKQEEGLDQNAQLNTTVDTQNAEVEELKRQLEEQEKKYDELLAQFEEIMENTGVYGQVYDSENKPVAKIPIFVVQSETKQQNEVVTDAKGYYKVTHLENGAYSVVCSLYPEDNVALNINYGKMVKQDFGSRKGVRVYGYVYDKDYNPLATRISIMSPEFKSFKTESSENGYYEFKNVPRLKYSVSVTAKSDGQRVITDPMIVPEKRTEYQNDIVLNALIISGYITDAETEEAIEGVKVQVGYRTDGVYSLAFTKSDETGFYELKYFQPGTYKVEFWPSGYKNKNHTVVLEEGKDATDANVALTAANPLWLLIKDQYGKSFEGNIFYGAQAKGAGSCYRIGPHAIDKGGLLCISNLGPGTYTITLESDGYDQFREEITIPEQGYPKGTPYEVTIEKLN